MTDASKKVKRLTYTYNEKTRRLDIRDEMEDERERRNESYAINIDVKYPYIAYQTLGASTKVLNIIVRGYLEGYNNPNSGFSNPVVSKEGSATIGIDLKNPDGDVIIFQTWANSIAKSRLRLKYDRNVDVDNRYCVEWDAKIQYAAPIESIIFEEDKEESTGIEEKYSTDRLEDIMGNYYGLEGIISYVGIKVPLVSLKILGENGYIKVINAETGQVVKKITSQDADNYIKYEQPIKHIRVETSKPKMQGELALYHSKKIDNEAFIRKYTKEQFNAMNYIYTAVNGSIRTSGNIHFVNRDVIGLTCQEGSNCFYGSSELQLNTQEMNKKEVSIGLVSNNPHEVETDRAEWLNPIFLLEYPEEVENITIQSIVSGESELVPKEIKQETINGKKIVRIKMEGLTKDGNLIYIMQHIKMDDRTQKATGKMRIFAYNELCDTWGYYYTNSKREADIYDINQDGNKTELRYISETELIYTRPTGIYSNIQALNFDDTNKIIMGPEVAEIDKHKKKEEATIRLNVYNNYNTTVTNAKIVGKIPFKGNTYQINGGNIGSQFTTTMKETGIQLPDNLKGKVEVYYSTNESVNPNLKDSTNGWTKMPSDWSKVKTYLIDLSKIVMNPGDKYTAEYNIKFPKEIEYDTVSYATHAIYFEENTTSGKVERETETNKVGFYITSEQKYTLQLTKLQNQTDKKIKGVKYKVEGFGLAEGIYKTTDEEGKIIIPNLYPEETYTLTEIYAPREYIIKEEPIQLQTYLEDGELKARIIGGAVKQEPTVEAGNTTSPIIKIEVENEVKYTLNITKYKEKTQETIERVRFNLKGKGFAETGRLVSTDAKGKVSITGLHPNEIYTLEEISVPSDYVLDSTIIQFKIVETNGQLDVEMINGNFKENPNIKQESRIVEVSIENEPKYELNVVKYKKGTRETIRGVTFNIKGEDLPEKGRWLTTDGDGNVRLEGLIPEKTYILQETTTKNDYILNKEPITFKLTKENENLKFQKESGEVKESVVEQVEEGKFPKLILDVENEPKYELNVVKYKKGTKKTIGGVTFNIKGEGLPEEGKKITTDSEGKVKLGGLIPEEMYILEEIATTDDYILNKEPIIFKLTKENENLKFHKESGEVKGSVVEQVAEGKLPKLILDVENEPKYGLHVIKYKKGTEEKISDTIFCIKGEGLPEKGVNLTTNENGIAQIERLIPEAEYTLQEVKANSNFILDNQLIKFKTVKKEENNLDIQILDGNVRKASIQEEQENLYAKIEIDNETKYQIEINKQEAGTNNTLEGVKFVVKGKDFPTEGGLFTTDEHGKITITSLELGEVYTIKESYAKGYYVNEEEFTVKLERIDGELRLVCEGVNAKQTPVLKQEPNQVPSVQIILENQKIPTYSLELTKVAKETGKLLKGAKFEITGKGRETIEEKEYISAENGKFTIEKLYVNEEYTLKEILEPIGYKLDETPIKFKVIQTNNGWNLIEIEGKFSEEPVVEGNIIKVKKENEPQFKLEKKDGETGMPIQGTKFTIKDLDGNNARDVSGNEIGIIENIDGEEKRVVTTDENGVITEEIAEGLYEVTEVKPANGYKFPRQTIQYFGINRSQETIKNLEIKRSAQVQSGMIIERVIPTNDGGFWAVGSKGGYRRSISKM